MATNNPYRPGISSVPSYLADRERNIRHFKKVLTDFPEICSNVRVSGLRGVGKSVLLKKYKEDAEKLGWITISRDLSRKLCQEDELLEAMKEDWKSTTNKLSSTKNILDKTSKFLDIQDDLDEEFYEPRVEELAPAEQGIVRLAGSLSKESFKLNELIKKAFTEMNKSERAVQSSIAKLVSEGVIYRIRQGEYAYTAPMFGDFLRRKYPI